VCHFLPATVYFLTVTTVQWYGENLTVSDNDQFAIIVITVLGLICKNMKRDKENEEKFYNQATLKTFSRRNETSVGE
jgi:hypothetical protein